MQMGMCLPMFDDYQGKAALNCFQSHVKNSYLISGLKFALYNVTWFPPDNLIGI